jgi:hypothetical protein
MLSDVDKLLGSLGTTYFVETSIRECRQLLHNSFAELTDHAYASASGKVET